VESPASTSPASPVGADLSPDARFLLRRVDGMMLAGGLPPLSGPPVTIGHDRKVHREVNLEF